MSLIGTDASHFRKYLTTLGVSLIAGALSLSGLFFQLQSDLLVEDARIQTLSPVAQEVVRQRQDLLGIATSALPFALGGVLAIGIGLASYGLFGWSKRQAVSDRKDELEGVKLEHEVRKMTKEEREHKATQEVAEAADAPRITTERPKRTVLVPPRTVKDDLPGRRAAEVDESTAVRRYREIEELVGALVIEAFSKERTRTHLVIDSGDRRLPLDIVVSPSAADTGYVFDVKYIRSAQRDQLSRRLREAVASASLGATYLSDSKGAYRPVVVVVYDSRQGGAIEERLKRYTEAASTFDQDRADLIAIDDETLTYWSSSDLLVALE